MRAEIVAGAPPTRSRAVLRPVAATPARKRRRLDRFELAVLAAFSSLSVWILLLDLYQVVAHGRVWTGTDGFYLVDQMQYLAWIRDASHHVLASNLYVLSGTPADYFQPAVAISGGLTALGMAPWLSLLVWKPVAVLAAFFAMRELAHRSLRGRWPRRSALVLGLLFGSVTVVYGSTGIIGDMYPAFLSWGYTFGLLAVATMVLALLSYARGRTWAPALLGALVSLLHPWQGELLILVIAGGELLTRRGRPLLADVRRPLTVLIAAGIPLAYYVILGRADRSWRMAQEASSHTFPLLPVLLGLAPLLALALVAYPGRSRSFLAAAMRIWPAAALAVYLVSETGLSGAPVHAFDGITIPLAVLAVEGAERAGVRRLPARRALLALGLAAATIPAAVLSLESAAGAVTPAPGNANFITHGEERALRFLARDPQPGGVLTRFYLGDVIPALTGRRTFIGDCPWSQPDCVGRAELAQLMFSGTLPPGTTRTLVRDTGARFVLADCDTPPGMDAVMRPISASIVHFGCATVYVLTRAGPAARALAESPADAALRASGRQQRRVQSS